MNDKLEKKIMDAYREGSEIGIILECFQITYKTVEEALMRFKESNKLKKGYTDEFKKLIAERDINGVERKKIANELKINMGTIRKACEKFGQTFKEKSSLEQFDRVEGDFNGSTCPICGDRKVNRVDIDTYYCMKCGDEHIINDGFALVVKWETIDD